MHNWDVLWCNVVARPYCAEHSTDVTAPTQNNQPITQSQTCINAGQWICDWSVCHIHDVLWTACPHGTSAQCIHTALLITNRQTPHRNITHRQEMKTSYEFIRWHHQAKLLSGGVHPAVQCCCKAISCQVQHQHNHTNAKQSVNHTIAGLHCMLPVDAKQIWWVMTLCAAVRCGVLMQCSVRQPNDAMRWSSLIELLMKKVQQKCFMKMLKKELKHLKMMSADTET